MLVDGMCKGIQSWLFFVDRVRRPLKSWQSLCLEAFPHADAVLRKGEVLVFAARHGKARARTAFFLPHSGAHKRVELLKKLQCYFLRNNLYNYYTVL